MFQYLFYGKTCQLSYAVANFARRETVSKTAGVCKNSYTLISYTKNNFNKLSVRPLNTRSLKDEL